jgi:ATP-binding cassette, subfamily G (WHITE), member 2, SNQ2
MPGLRRSVANIFTRGDAYTRGVSGGERKRVSIIEVMANRGSIFCWDNSTRGGREVSSFPTQTLTFSPTGLDASTALAYVQAIRTLTDVLGLTSVITLYQAGNGIFDLFDKVLVLDLGKQIYYGPREQAKPFFESLGFEYTKGANFGDYLTGCVVPTERRIRPGYENRYPRTADEIRAAYQQSAIYEKMRAEIGYAESEEALQNTEEFKRSVDADRHKSLPKQSALTVPYTTQIYTLTVRQYQIIWGNKVAAIIRQGATLVQSLVIGSLFYNIPPTSNGLFLLGGTLFFSVLYNR